MSCSVSTLTINLLDNCLPNGQGLYEKMFSIRLTDIVSVAYDSVNPKIVTGFTLKTGAKFKVWQGKKFSHKRTTGFSANDNGNLTPHGLTFAVFNNSPEADAEVDTMKDLTDLVTITKQNGANGRWRINGYPTGMACTNLSEDSNNADLPGVYVLDFTAAQASKTALTMKHITASVDDTEDYLTTWSTPIV